MGFFEKFQNILPVYSTFITILLPHLIVFWVILPVNYSSHFMSNQSQNRLIHIKPYKFSHCAIAGIANNNYIALIPGSIFNMDLHTVIGLRDLRHPFIHRYLSFVGQVIVQGRYD